MKKLILTILVLMVALLAIGKVRAADYSITQIDVDGTTVFENGNQITQVNVERGETTVIEVWLEGADNISDDSIDNVKIKAWIGGFENYDIEERTSAFEVEEGITYKRTLRLEIPFDAQLDENEDFTLNVEAYDHTNSIKETFQLRLNEKRHALYIQDVIFNPDLEINAGKTLFAKVRVENLGDRKEEDIKVTLTIPELGLSTRTYIDELVDDEDSDNGDEDEETSASTEDLFLRIPENVKSGVYDVRVTLDYNRGFNTLSKTYKLNVLGGITTVQPGMETVTVDSTSKEVMQGKGVVYKVTVANLGTTAKQYSLDVSGVGDWGTYRVDPSFVVVQPTQTSEMFVFVSARESAEQGSKLFTVRVTSDGNVVKTLNLEADVTGSLVQPTSQFDNLKRGLEIGFIVLLIILVILGLILAITRMRKGEEKREEASTEGQTYY